MRLHRVSVVLIAIGSLCPAIAARSATSAVVFMYHHIATDTPPSTSTSPERFGEQMTFLEREGYSVLPLMDVVSRLREGREVPERTVVLTFDDGYTSVLTTAAPELERRGWPFTIFVTPQYVDEGYGGYLTWDELREAVAKGATIGNHSVTHTHLVRRDPGEGDAAYRARIRQEISAAGARIEAALGGPGLVPAFAYPYGEYDSDITEIVAGLGLVAFGQQSGAIGHDSDWLALPRFPVAQGYDELADFALRARTQPLYLEVASPHSTLNDAPDGRPAFEAGVPADLARIDELACYASGQGRLDLTWATSSKRTVIVKPRLALGPGRAKINCTVPHASRSGVYLWFGKLWLTRRPDGSWYSE